MRIPSPPGPPLEGLSPVHLPMQASEHNHCFGCARQNPAGLALELHESGEDVICDFTLSRLHESYPGVVHGGVAAAVLDEVMGNLIVHREKKVCFTTTLRITYLGTLRVDQPYRAVARLVQRPSEPSGLYKVTGEIRDSAGTVLVMSKASFQWMTSEQYRRVAGSTSDPDPVLMRFMRHE